MKRLMFMPFVLMDAAGGGGGGAGDPPPNDPPKNDPPPSDPPPNGDPKPFLGDPPKDGEPKPNDPPKNDPPPTFEEKDYLEGIKVDEAIVGKDSGVEIDQGMIKAMAPVFKEFGIKPEQASKLANTLAKIQIEQAKAESKGRIEFFNKMKEEAVRKYNEGDWSQINKGIDACFKQGGVMNYLIRNSELGADPEFLALMHKMGAAHVEDRGSGGAAGAGGSGGVGYSGISSIWK